MKYKIPNILSAFILVAGFMTTATGDVLEINDGSRLMGAITQISDGVIHIETAYAGSLKINQSVVVGFSTDNPVFVRLQSGTTIGGKVKSSGGQKLEISGTDGTLTTDMGKVTASWGSGGIDPEVAQARAEAEKLKGKWAYEATLDISGKSGNSDELGTSVGLSATLARPQDELKFYSSYEQSSKNGVKSANEIIGGGSYSNFFYDKTGWYVRGELENDEFENLDLRTTVALGFTRRFIHEETTKLVGRTGLSYLYESFSNGVNNDNLGLDFGLEHAMHLGKIGKLTNNFSFVPTFEDFGNYRFKQDSALTMPLGSDFWKLRIGLANDYNSTPAPGLKELDTTYYARMVLSWD